jgi:hypothetical protein
MDVNLSERTVHTLAPVDASGSPLAIILGYHVAHNGKPVKHSSPRPLGITPRKFNNAPPKMDSKKWLALGVSTDPKRESLTTIHGTWAADGFRMYHILDAQNLFDCTCESCKAKLTPDFTNVLGRGIRKNWKTKITVSRNDLILACNAADAMSRDATGAKGPGVLPLTFEHLNHPDKLSYLYTSEETGKTTGEIETYQLGDSVKIGISFDFLRDTLLGMDDTVTIQLSGNSGPIYITDGVVEAVIMPMHLG